MTNRRLLEAEIIAVLREYGYTLDDNPNTGDKLLIIQASDDPTELNITDLARALSDRVEVKSTAVRVTI